jgi:DNA-directed RNA polymerase subunit omega
LSSFGIRHSAFEICLRVHLKVFRPLARAGPAQRGPGPTRRQPYLPKRPNFSVALRRGPISFSRSNRFKPNEIIVNSEYSRQALAKVGNPNILINLISRRVRQLNSGGGAVSRPLIQDSASLGAADIALREIIDEKMGWEVPEELRLLGATATGKKRRK